MTLVVDFQDLGGATVTRLRHRPVLTATGKQALAAAQIVVTDAQRSPGFACRVLRPAVGRRGRPDPGQSELPGGVRHDAAGRGLLVVLVGPARRSMDLQHPGVRRQAGDHRRVRGLVVLAQPDP